VRILTAQLALFFALSSVALGQTNESFFAQEVYPLFLRVQCNLCHNDNGVAARTAFQFPDAEASPDQIAAFGYQMLDLVNRDDPTQSMLLLKPTMQVPHTGGERFAADSDDAATLSRWIRHLAGLSETDIAAARERIRQASQHQAEALSIRRLTHSQYNNTVRDLLDDQTRPADGFPQEDFVSGFKNRPEGQGIPPLLAEAYSAAAERVARGAFRGGDQQGLIPCEPRSVADQECAEAFVKEFGGKAFRRPLSASEIGAYTGLLRAEATGLADFVSGAQVVVEAMLQSPHFLFRTEHGSTGELAQYETASRLSYFLWDTMPSDELLSSAAAGKLGNVDQVESIARKMLKDSRARTSMEEFLSQWLRFDRALTATRERRLFPAFSSELAGAMTEETRQLFNYLVWDDGDFREFFSADYSFVSTALAELYGMSTPVEEFARVAYPGDSGRGGVLGHGSIMTLTSSPSDTSPTARGLFVREHFLCHEVPPPPPGVDATLPMVTELKPLTNRDRLEIHLNSPPCMSCHSLIDSIGVGFEQYDAIGKYREELLLKFRGPNFDEADGDEKQVEVKLKLDTDAHVQGLEGSEFSTPKQLGQILADDPGCQRCVVKQLFRYAMGREETAGDQSAIDEMLATFESSEFRFREMMVAVVKSEPFLGRGVN
jgi:hypothetical protein